MDKAKQIKEGLIGSRAHANYNKRTFDAAARSMDANQASIASLTDDQKERLQRQRLARPKPAVQRVTSASPDTGAIARSVSELLPRTVASQVVDALANDREVASWVQLGLKLHSNGRVSDECRFCGNAFTEARRAELVAHFNDEFRRFQQEIDHLIATIDRDLSSLDAVRLPPPASLYEHLSDKMTAASEDVKSAVGATRNHLGALRSELERKRAALFDALVLFLPAEVIPPARDAVSTAIAAVNSVIDEHEATTQGLDKTVSDACAALERAAVAEAHSEYERLTDVVKQARFDLASIADEPGRLSGEIARIEREIVESRRPADELNRELRDYLGRDELQFEVRESGYVLLRGGTPVAHLSEGEKTAIGFLYFLKSLQDKTFDLSTGVVVIDDPVSSLDSNGLFSAFSFMKERTKTCGQLFVLTHNFAFFSQVKNWVNHLPGQRKTGKKAIEKRPGRLFLLCTHPHDPTGERTAVLGPIDRLLHEFESEYHYLFRCVYRESKRKTNGVDLESRYGLPNIARRLLEAFLAFKHPSRTRDLHACLEQVDFDAARKTRLQRFLNTYSHANAIAEQEHDPHVLSEAPEVMGDLLDLMEVMDSDHFAGLEQLVTDGEVADAGEGGQS